MPEQSAQYNKTEYKEHDSDHEMNTEREWDLHAMIEVQRHRLHVTRHAHCVRDQCTKQGGQD